MLANKNIVVIGGSSGMGLSAVQAFLQAGARVVALGKADTAMLVQANESLQIVAADARLEGSADQAIKVCQQYFGTVDGLYHVAGGSGRSFGDGPLHEMSLEGWNKTMELNLVSVMLSNKAAINAFLLQGGGGSILNMSSVLSVSPAPQYFTTHAYAAAKAAIIGFSKSVAAYYSKDNIRVNVVAPALVQTPMAKRAVDDKAIMKYIQTKQPLDGGRIGNAGDLDGAACYFMSDLSKFTTGQTIFIDGGWSVSDGQYA